MGDQPAPPITHLPPEILVRIFTFLAHTRSLISASQSCRAFYAQIFDISADKYIWKAAAREACGFGGAVFGLDLGDIDQSFDKFVHGGIPETQDDLWAIGMGPSVIEVKEDVGLATGKGKEKEGCGKIQVDVKPLYRDMCKAQIIWTRIGGDLAAAAMRSNASRKLETTQVQEGDPAPPTTARGRRLARLAKRQKLTRQPFKQAETSLPPLTASPNPDTHFTQRVFSIIHTATEGGRVEVGPPMLSAKLPTWAETLEEYPLGYNNTGFSILPREDGIDGEHNQKRIEWERRVACGGSANSLGFMVFTDDPRTLGDREVLDEAKFTVRRAIVGGYLGPRTKTQGTIMQIDDESGIGGSPQQSVAADISSPSEEVLANATPQEIDRRICKMNALLAKVQYKAMRISCGQYIPSHGLKMHNAVIGSTPELSPWLKDHTFSESTQDFIRPLPHDSIFPSLRRFDDSRTLITSIAENFPDIAETPNWESLEELEKLGFRPEEIDRWLRSTVYSDANLRIIPALRKPSTDKTQARDGAAKSKIEASAVERLTINHDGDGSVVGTMVNTRWVLPESESLLRIQNPFYEDPSPPGQSTSGQASAPPGPGSAFASSALHTTLPGLMMAAALPSMLHHGVTNQAPPYPAAYLQMLTAQHADDSTWEYRSRGPYLICCDDNGGLFPSTISCFRAKPSGQLRTSSKMGDLLWQRLMVVPLAHHREQTRHSIAAEIRTHEQVLDLHHEYYFLDNDGLKMTSSVVVYSTRRHIISQFLERTRALVGEHAGRDRNTEQGKDPWGIGTRTGIKSVCEFWVIGLENGHTLKILSLAEEEREVPVFWCGWTSFDVTDAGGIAATVGGNQDILGFQNTIKAVRARACQQRAELVPSKGKKPHKCTHTESDEEDDDNSDDNSTVYSSDSDSTDFAISEDGEAPDSDSDDEFLHDGEYEYPGEMWGDDADSEEQFPRYQHKYLFCWNFSTDSSDEPPHGADSRLQLIPLRGHTYYSPYVAISPCGRFVTVSSKLEFSVWDLYNHGSHDIYRIRRKDFMRLKHSNYFDPIHDRQDTATHSEENDEIELQSYNGLWVLWHDISVPRHFDHNSPAATAQPNTLCTGVSYLNNRDMRRYVDGIDVDKDIQVRKLDYLAMLSQMKARLKWELKNCGVVYSKILKRPISAKDAVNNPEWLEEEEEEDEVSGNVGEGGSAGEDDDDDDDDGRYAGPYGPPGGAGGAGHLPHGGGPPGPGDMPFAGYDGMPGNLWTGLALLHEAFMINGGGPQDYDDDENGEDDEDWEYNEGDDDDDDDDAMPDLVE